MKAWVFGGMLVLSAALAACSSSSSDDGAGGGGGGDGAGGGDGGSGSVTSGTNTGSTTGTTTPATTSTTTGTTTGGGNGVCDTGLSLDQGGAADTCLDANCCTEFTACFGADGSNLDACNACLEAGSGALCDGLIACDTENQCTGGGGGGICDSGLSVGDDATDACLGDACCAEFNACTQDGADPDACIACFEAEGGPLCDAAIACSDESGCFGSAEGVCGTGLTFDQGGALDTCIDDNCCTEFTACAGADGANADACNACLEAGSGALCDDFLACAETNGCG